MNSFIRQFHRWISIFFVLIVAAIFTMQAMGQKPAMWIYLSPLAPLALLALTGLYLFALPYAIRMRR
jgi:hypothetical protein